MTERFKPERDDFERGSSRKKRRPSRREIRRQAGGYEEDFFNEHPFVVSVDASIVATEEPATPAPKFIIDEVYGGTRAIFIPVEFFTSRASQVEAEIEKEKEEIARQQRLLTFRKNGVGGLKQRLDKVILTQVASSRTMVAEGQRAFDNFLTAQELPFKRSRVALFEMKLARIKPNLRMILGEEHEIFGAPKEVLSPADFTWPRFIMNEKAEVFGTPREILSPEDFSLPLSEAEVQRLELLQKQKLEETELTQMQTDYKELARNLILYGPLKHPINERLRAKEVALDRALVLKSEQNMIVCLESYAEGLGVTDEDIPPLQYRYMLRIIKQKDPSALLFNNIRGETPITPAACLFLWGKTRYMSVKRMADLERFLLVPENNARLIKNVRHDEEGQIVVDENDPSGEHVISLAGLIPLYAEWMVQAHQPR